MAGAGAVIGEGVAAVAVAVAAECKAEGTDTHTTGTPGSTPTLGLIPSPVPTPFAFEDPRVTYVTPPPNQGYGGYHSVPPKQIKFNVSQIVLLVQLYVDCIPHLLSMQYLLHLSSLPLHPSLLSHLLPSSLLSLTAIIHSLKARVLVTFGLKDSDTERVDHLFAKKLR